MTIVGGEERARRAREVLAETPHADDCRYIMAVREGDEDAHYVDCTCDRPIRAMLAFADEGSGIGELREALKPYLQHRTDCRNRLRMGQRGCSCGLADILAASPDIDRSGLAQEVD